MRHSPDASGQPWQEFLARASSNSMEHSAHFILKVIINFIIADPPPPVKDTEPTGASARI